MSEMLSQVHTAGNVLTSCQKYHVSDDANTMSCLQMLKHCGPLSKMSMAWTAVTGLAAFFSVTPPPSTPLPDMKMKPETCMFQHDMTCLSETPGWYVAYDMYKCKVDTYGGWAALALCVSGKEKEKTWQQGCCIVVTLLKRRMPSPLNTPKAIICSCS